MRMRSRNGCVILAVCTFAYTFYRSVHVAIEMHAHPMPVVLKQVYGAGSLATFKGDIGPAYEYEL